MTVTLTKAEALPKMREAYKAGILLKQRFPKADAAYRGQGNAPCIVGVLLDDETTARIDDGAAGYASIRRLIELGVVKTDDDDFFHYAQMFHDSRRWGALEQLLGIVK